MDFKSLMSLFREDDWTAALVDLFDEMLVLASGMFGHTRDRVVDGRDDHEPTAAIYEPDKRINGLMRQIRRRVVSRLVMAGNSADVPTAVIFMNAVKDAERIGDYIKNLYEIAELMPEDPDRALYRAWLAGRCDRIGDLLDRTRGAFAAGDEAAAATVIADARQLSVECEEAIREITDWAGQVRDAVCLVLALRFLKRIASHLSNIATTLVMPVDLLDFHDESPPDRPRRSG
ncbi:hypothetical protein GF314_01200 [bacterium]|nr:hypothetical protein [bacterium]